MMQRCPICQESIWHDRHGNSVCGCNRIHPNEATNPVEFSDRCQEERHAMGNDGAVAHRYRDEAGRALWEVELEVERRLEQPEQAIIPERMKSLADLCEDCFTRLDGPATPTNPHGGRHYSKRQESEGGAVRRGGRTIEQ